MKKCPFCAEEIQDDAIKCKHCKEFLQTETTRQQQKLPWYFRTSAIIAGFFCVGPLALPQIWFHPKLSLLWKGVITVITLVASYFIYLASIESFRIITEQYKILSELSR